MSPHWTPVAMRDHLIRSSQPVFIRGLAAVLLAVSTCTGCNTAADDQLLVATTLPAAERRQVEADFREWQQSQGQRMVPGPLLRWHVLAERDDPVRLVERPRPPDVLLGVLESSCLRLAQSERLATLDRAGGVRWLRLNCATPALADTSSRAARLERATDTTDRPQPAHLAARAGSFSSGPFQDPRSHPIALAWAVGQLGGGRWRKGYARLIRLAGAESAVMSAPANAQKGPPALASGGELDRPGSALGACCAAVVSASRNKETARRFLHFLAEARGLEPGEAAEIDKGAGAGDAAVSSLIGDLLGSTIFDARDELWVAWSALRQTGYPPTALNWMIEPPAWPPASVDLYLRAGGESAMSLVSTLAAELAPDPTERAWLLASWLAPARNVDEALLLEIARAADGRLGREPRFRAWLAAEWTASARQRYRRVARLAAAGERPVSDWQ